MPEIDIECNSYNRKIGANNRSVSKTNKKSSRDKLMDYSMPKPFKFMTCLKRHNPNIIKIELLMKWNVIESMLSLLKIREIVNVINIKIGLNKRNMNSISLLLTIS